MQNNTTSTAVYPSDYYTDAQQYAIAIVPKITGTLSLLGSLCIITSVLRTRKSRGRGNSNQNSRSRARVQVRRRIEHRRSNRSKRSNIQKRLLLGLSFCDVIQSLCHICSTWPIPRDTIYKMKFNVGNNMTCTIQGFLLSFGSLGGTICNTSLCFYYYICVRYGGRKGENRVAKRSEPFFHAISLIIPLCFSVFCLLEEVYNDNGRVCFITVYPKRCESEENSVKCIRGQNADRFRKLGILIVIICFIIMVVSLSLLYRIVKHQERRMIRYSFEPSASTNIEKSGEQSKKNDAQAELEASSTERDHSNNNIHNHHQQYRTSSFLSATTSSSTSAPATAQQCSRRWLFFSSSSFTQNNKSNKGAKRVFRQSLFYWIPFLLVWCPTLIQMIISNKVENINVALCFVILIAIFAPLQVSKLWRLRYFLVVIVVKKRN